MRDRYVFIPYVYAVIANEPNVPMAPYTVLTLYTNEHAAKAHAATSDRYDVMRWEVYGAYPQPEAGEQICAACSHVLEPVGNEWRCAERCRCTMAGCPPRRSDLMLDQVLGAEAAPGSGAVEAAGEPCL